MMRCVHSITYAVKINGKPEGNITPLGFCTKEIPCPIFAFIVCRRLICTSSKVNRIENIEGNGSMC